MTAQNITKDTEDKMDENTEETLAESEVAPDESNETGEEEVQSLDGERLVSVIESLLFASNKILSVKELARLTRVSDKESLKQALTTLEEIYSERGIQLHSVAGGYQFRTHPENSEWVQKLIAGRPVRLSRAQLESLAIIAYRQPVTKPEIDMVRGVDSGATLRLLLDRNLIRVMGKKEEAGRPLLYGTADYFLEFFNLTSLRELPSLREFHELTEESAVLANKAGFSLDDLKETEQQGEADVETLADGDTEGEEEAEVTVNEDTITETDTELEFSAVIDEDGEFEDAGENGPILDNESGEQETISVVS